jgi:hypothetical protein
MVGIQHIIGIPPQVIIIGIPAAIMAIMRSQAIFIMSMVMPSAGIILQTIPVGVISAVMVQEGICIGIGIIMGMPMFIGICMPIFIGIGIGIGICIIMFIGIGMGMFIGIPMFMGIAFIGICIAVIMIFTLNFGGTLGAGEQMIAPLTFR